jgi:hypothetical protein
MVAPEAPDLALHAALCERRQLRSVRSVSSEFV